MFFFKEMSALYLTLIYLHIFVSISLILLIVLQKTTGNGLFTSSQTNPFMSGSEITHFITKITVVFITIFFINTLVLAKLSSMSLAKKSLLTQEIQQEVSELPSSQSSVPLS